MTQAAGIPEHVRAARLRLAEGRETLRALHQAGTPPREVCRAITAFHEELVLGVYEGALAHAGPSAERALRENTALVAHGGFGRRDMAPFSDVDLMVLHAPLVSADQVVPFVNRLVRDMYDVGLPLGHSVRTPRQACAEARKDVIVTTSLIESRPLAGNQNLFQDYWRRFSRQVTRFRGTLLDNIERARNQEQSQYGESIYLLQPNVKRSRGGLRDAQYLRWISFVSHGTVNPTDLLSMGHLAKEDVETLVAAQDMLLEIRNELHFHANKSQDVLDRAEQVRLAQLRNYPAVEGLLPVEQFMREYFRTTGNMNNVVRRFCASLKRPKGWNSFLSPLFSHQFEREFRITLMHVQTNRRGTARLKESLDHVLKLIDLAHLYDRPIAPATLEVIRDAVGKFTDEIAPEVSQRFLAMLDRTSGLGHVLRSMHEMGVLELLLPAFRHARCLLQFNEYHKFTVDEHSIRAVEQANEIANNPLLVGDVYRNLKRKWLLHLALLIHDLGKGFPEDHSEVGRRIAEETARRLGLTEPDAEVLIFLVHKHLHMSHLAFYRDTSDPQLVLRFAAEVGSTEVLQMLFVLSCADLAAVGPGVLNAWKTEVLTDLYRRTLQTLSPSDARGGDQVARRVREVLQGISANEEFAWFEQQLHSLPQSYLLGTPVETIREDLARVKSLPRGKVVAQGRYLPELAAVEYKVSTHEDIAPGVFFRLAGALSRKGLQILAAEINTLEGGLVFDRFLVHDGDFSGPPPQERHDDVCLALCKSLLDSHETQTPFRRIWKTAAATQSAIPAMPTRILCDNATSERFTIIDVFTEDRMGLLYTIARTIYQAGCSVSLAKIATYLDQVVDIFYVTDSEGRKIENEGQLATIRERLNEAIANLKSPTS